MCFCLAAFGTENCLTIVYNCAGLAWTGLAWTGLAWTGLAWTSRGGVRRDRGEAGGYLCSWVLCITVDWYPTAQAISAIIFFV